MNEWKAHLTSQGGSQTDTGQWQFPADANAQTSTGHYLVPLSHLAILECEGADATRFLQGQASAHTDHANGDFAPLTAFCGPKGRMIANAELLQVAPERYWLLLHASLCEPLATQLGKYAPFYKVQLRQRDDLALLGVIGAPETLDAGVPTGDWHMQATAEHVLLRQPGPSPRVLLALTPPQAIDTWNRLRQDHQPAGTALWQQADIEAGVAWLTAAHSDSLLPQMINWEALGGISFRKGCYTGQEVVARAHFRGQVKRRLQIARLDGATPPDVGSDIRCDEKRVGEIFQAVSTGDSCLVLAVLNTSVEETAALEVDSRRLTRQPLPYALERLDPENAVAATSA
ncbi:CAF17-like 4Fe-4S cluster assembly/insertion protein YgfZ [Salinicola avicenniae]|uniref:CAF17-like 4Fe-4S cluster assembly/insertion protein YgfZ n=1 Tax=Salinicola avicenniae TaxID=2916836 RepID=UPI002074039A|nr:MULTISPECIES: folate-binding protein [unclassified Salinicola]